MIVVFDIDGTLCRTSGVDDRCWSQAAEEVIGVRGMSTDWSDYPHSTDESIACALIREHLDREPDRALLDRLRDRFVELLHETLERDPGQFLATPGAEAMLAHLQGRGASIAIATGGWRRSARLKLEAAGIVHEGLPAAFADDAHPREAIIGIALERAAQQRGCAIEALGPRVYVGDGLWDLRAAGRLGMDFVGLADGGRASELRASGANIVMADFTDLQAFEAALDCS